MSDWLKPVTVTEPRPGPSEPAKLLYVRSYLIMRLCVGALGIALPFFVILGDLPLSSDRPIPRDSLSAYYFSGVRDYFVGVLVIVAVFLITYKVVEKNLDNLLTLVAGFAALAVALFPTGTSDSKLTPLQRALGVGPVQTVHFIGAAVFIGSLGVICCFFGIREGKRGRRPNARHSPEFWRRFHWTCAAVIAGAIAFLPFGKWVLDLRTTLLVSEVIAVVAFGISWLLKGFERDILTNSASEATIKSAA